MSSSPASFHVDPLAPAGSCYTCHPAGRLTGPVPVFEVRYSESGEGRVRIGAYCRGCVGRLAYAWATQETGAFPSSAELAGQVDDDDGDPRCLCIGDHDEHCEWGPNGPPDGA